MLQWWMDFVDRQLWAAGAPNKLSKKARILLNEPENLLIFSAASLRGIAVKQNLGQADFSVDKRLLRRGLLDSGYELLSVTSCHAIALGGLPPIHRDPFDRMLIAQAQVEGITLLTVDEQISKYPGPVQMI